MTNLTLFVDKFPIGGGGVSPPSHGYESVYIRIGMLYELTWE